MAHKTKAGNSLARRNGNPHTHTEVLTATQAQRSAVRDWGRARRNITYAKSHSVNTIENMERLAALPLPMCAMEGCKGRGIYLGKKVGNKWPKYCSEHRDEAAKTWRMGQH